MTYWVSFKRTFERKSSKLKMSHIFYSMKKVHFKMIEKSNLTIQKKAALYWLPETNMTSENRPFAPKGKDRIPTIHFQVRFLRFREGSSWARIQYVIACFHKVPHREEASGWWQTQPGGNQGLLDLSKKNAASVSTSLEKWTTISLWQHLHNKGTNKRTWFNKKKLFLIRLPSGKLTWQ